MGIAFLHGNGGGVPLNFKIVDGTTEPTNPKENMIWVNTDQKITGWNFGATDPFNFKVASNAGDVVGTAGGITFTKKNAGKAIFAFVRNETFTIPLLISDSQDAAVLARSDGEEHEAFAFTYKDKLWYNTYPGLGMDLWDTATPKIENTTDIVAIKEYLVDMLEKAEGVVWFQTGATSPVEFNALKKNAIQVAPLSAKQYRSGAWTNVPAKIYQEGEWVDVARYLYNAGNEYKDITGGWNVLSVANDNYSDWNAITEKSSDHMRIGVSASSSMQRLICAQTVKKVNLSDVSTLNLEYEISGTTDKINFGFVVASAAYTTSTIAGSFDAETKLSVNENVAKLDVSNITGEYYIIVRIYMGSSASANTALKINSVYMG